MVSLGGQLPGGVYIVTIVFLLMAALAQVFLKKTKYGTYIYAIGANRKSAEYSGISFVKTKIMAFMISGFCAFVAAMFTIGRYRSNEVATGQTFALQAISAAVIGGAAFTGGRGDMTGTVIGLLSHLVFPTPIGSNYSHTHFADEEMEPQEAMEFSQTHPIYKCA